MSMLSIGLSGLQTTQSALEITSNNIANSATAGFKTATAEFASTYSGSERSGVRLNDVKEDFNTSGEVVRTGSALDIGILGSGFFALAEGAGRTAYTQAGQFQLDAEQFIVNATGSKLQGYSVDENRNLISGELTALQVQASNIPAQQSSRIDFSLNLNSSSELISVPFDPLNGSTYNYSQSTEVFDSLGVGHTLTQYFVHNGSNQWETHYYVDGAQVSASTVDTSVSPRTSTTPSLTTPLTFSSSGELTSHSEFNLIEIEFDPSATTGATPMTIQLNMENSSQFGSAFSMYQNEPDGYRAGEFSRVAVEDDGSIYATYTNGEKLLQGQIVLASFANLNGLDNGDGSVWYETSESGSALFGMPNEGNYGEILSGAYISSNVNISDQLVDLVSFQQNYQANARTISSSDEMMQILFNTV